jgi:hypothetical protein
MEEHTGTLVCGAPFTQSGADNRALAEPDILGPSEALRHKTDYFSHTKHARQMLERLASPHPTTLACTHGGAWGSDGAKFLRTC